MKGAYQFTNYNGINPWLRPEGTRQYAELKSLLRQKGFFKKQPRYYIWKIVFTLGLLVSSGTCLLLTNHVEIQLLNAVYLAFVTTQLGLLGHDAGHRQIFSKSWKNHVFGLIVGNLLVGISNAYWIDKHNKHHRNPNQLDVDPDIDIPLLAFSAEDITRKKGLQQGGMVKFIIKYQHLFFFPMLTLTFLDLKQQSVQFLLEKKGKYSLLEVILLLIHFCCYFGILFWRFEIWLAILFIIVHQGLTGVYMGSIFAPNHKGMPLIDSDQKIDFLHRQVETSRNVRAHPLVDFWYGGLNYQIEHHLFPTIPRNKLRSAQSVVRLFCKEHDITYIETSFIESYCEVIKHLKCIGSLVAYQSPIK